MDGLERSSARKGLGPRLVLFLLLTANLINFVDRTLLAGFSNDIVKDLHLSATEFGLLTGLGFVFFYAVASPIMGGLGDLVNRSRLISGAVGSWSILTAVSGLATSFASLAAPRVFIGIGEAALTPVSISLLAERFSEPRRGLVTAIYYAGVPLGVGVSLLIAGVAGPALGWRRCFMLLGLVGLICALFLLLIKDSTPAQRGVTRSPLNIFAQISEGLGAIRRHRGLQFIIIAGLFVNAGLSAGNFDQLWLVHERNFPKATIAIISGSAAMFGGLIGNVLGGWGGDVWHRTTGRSRAVFLGIMLICFCPLLIGYRLVSPENPIFWLGFVAGYIQLGAFYAPTFATIQQLCPSAQRATITGVSLFLHNVVGFGLATTVAGLLVDHMKVVGIQHPYTVALVVIACFPAMGAPFALLVGRPGNGGPLGAPIHDAA